MTPSPHDRQTRAAGVGGCSPREGAAQRPQNHANSTSAVPGGSTSRKAGRKLLDPLITPERMLFPTVDVTKAAVEDLRRF
jgi:hypothetical protein